MYSKKNKTASFLSTHLNERSNPTGLLFSFVGGATLSSNRALRALRAQQNPVRIRRQSRRGANLLASFLTQRQGVGIFAQGANKVVLRASKSFIDVC
jgi:hypothetical protein